MAPVSGAIFLLKRKIACIQTRLYSHQNYACSDEEGGEPAAAADALVKENFRGDGVRDKSQRGRRRNDEAEIAPGEPEEQAIEGDAHGQHAKKKCWSGEDASNDAEKAVGLEEFSDVADSAHGVGEKNVASRGSQSDHGDRGPGVELVHGLASCVTGSG